MSFRERSHDNHTQFLTKMFKIYTRFQTKTAQKPYIPFGAAHTYTPYIGEYPPPRALFIMLNEFLALLRRL